MGYLYLILSKLSATGKIVSMKYCAMAAPGARNSVLVNLARSGICVLVGLLTWLVGGATVTNGVEGYGIIVLSGVANALILFVWIIATEYASVSLIEVFSTLGGVIIPVLLAPVVFPGETVSLWQWIATALLIAAAVLFSGKNNGQEKKGGVAKWILMALVVLAMAGVSLSQKMFAKYDSANINYFNFLTFVFAFAGFAIYFGIITLINAQKAKNAIKKCEDIPQEGEVLAQEGEVLAQESVVLPQKEKFPIGKVWYLIIIASVTLYVFQMLMTLATGLLDAAIVYPLGYAVGLIMVFIVDVLLFKEKITVKNGIGLVLAIVACVLANL